MPRSHPMRPWCATCGTCPVCRPSSGAVAWVCPHTTLATWKTALAGPGHPRCASSRASLGGTRLSRRSWRTWRSRTPTGPRRSTWTAGTRWRTSGWRLPMPSRASPRLSAGGEARLASGAGCRPPRRRQHLWPYRLLWMAAPALDALRAASAAARARPHRRRRPGRGRGRSRRGPRRGGPAVPFRPVASGPGRS